MPEKGVAMRTPTIALGSLPATEGLSSGEAELMRSGPGSCAAVSPAQCVPSVAGVGGDAGVPNCGHLRALQQESAFSGRDTAAQGGRAACTCAAVSAMWKPTLVA